MERIETEEEGHKCFITECKTLAVDDVRAVEDRIRANLEKCDDVIGDVVSKSSSASESLSWNVNWHEGDYRDQLGSVSCGQSKDANLGLETTETEPCSRMSVFDAVERWAGLSVVYESFYPELPIFDSLRKLSDLACEAEFLCYEAGNEGNVDLDPELFGLLVSRQSVLSLATYVQYHKFV
jgi:hypothetical protein